MFELAEAPSKVVTVQPNRPITINNDQQKKIGQTAPAAPKPQIVYTTPQPTQQTVRVVQPVQTNQPIIRVVQPQPIQNNQYQNQNQPTIRVVQPVQTNQNQ